MLDLLKIQTIAPIMVFLQRVAEPHDTRRAPSRIHQRPDTDRLSTLGGAYLADEQRLHQRMISLIGLRKLF